MQERQGTSAGARWLRSAAVLVALLTLLPGCGVVFDAPKVSVLVRDDRIVYAGANDEEQLVGGETVLKILNDGAMPRQVLLVRLEKGATELPPEIVEAEAAREDNRILGMTHVLKPKEATFATGGFGYKIDGSSFHVHLDTDSTYILFDRLGGLDDGVVLRIQPGAGAA